MSAETPTERRLQRIIEELTKDPDLILMAPRGLISIDRGRQAIALLREIRESVDSWDLGTMLDEKLDDFLRACAEDK